MATLTLISFSKCKQTNFLYLLKSEQKVSLHFREKVVLRLLSHGSVSITVCEKKIVVF